MTRHISTQRIPGRRNPLLTSQCYYCERTMDLNDLRWLKDRERYVCLDEASCDATEAAAHPEEES